MKKIKKNIARTFAFIGKLTAFSFLVIASFGVCCLLGSWTTNDDEQTYYDNYYQYHDYGFFGDINDIPLFFDSSNLFYDGTANTSHATENLTILDVETDASLGFSIPFYLVSNSSANNNLWFTLDTEISDLFEYVDTLYISFYYASSITFDSPDFLAFSWNSSSDANLSNEYEFANFAYDNFDLASNGVYVSNSSILEFFANSDTYQQHLHIYYCTFGINIAMGADDYNYLNIYNNLRQTYSLVGISPFIVSSSPFLPYGLDTQYISKEKYDTLKDNYDNLQDEYESLEDQANQWYLERRYYEDAYNELANTIDFGNYSIDFVRYNTSDTLSNNFTVLYTVSDISPYIVSNSYLDFRAILRDLPNLAQHFDVSTCNGFIINSSVDMSINQYNMLFNAISSPSYYIGLYYSDSSNDNLFVSYPLKVNTDNGADYYFNSYSLYDVLKTQGFDNLFSDFTYNKLAIHLTNASLNYMTINNIKLNSENGYNTGYSKGLLDSANTIASLQDNVNTLESQKQALNQRIEYLQGQLDNNLGWHSLFFSMADTPIKVVGGFLDYEILGINLFKALLGILTALAVIWLIKRFTR